jgi:putative sterol carrier protein
MQAASPRDFFENLLPKRFRADKASGIDVTVQVAVAGAEGGNWIVTIKDQKMAIKEGTVAAPTLLLKMADKDFMDLINGKLSAEKAFFSGKVQFKGNIRLALKLRDAGFL